MLIDTHCHINFKNFRDDADEVINRTLSNNTWLILVGTELKTSRRALDYANKYERGVYASVGLHPIHLEKAEVRGDDYSFNARGEKFNYEAYEKLAEFEKVVAIGETGLDYYHLNKSSDPATAKAKQQKVLVDQLKLARNLDLPLIIHCREAHQDMIKILKDFKRENKKLFSDGRPWGVMHCFSGDEDLAWQYFGLGLLVSFTGLITFNKSWDSLIRKMPPDKFLIETDSPYMTPAPFRGKRNEPIYVKQTALRIAEIKGLALAKIAEVSTNNARKLFRI